jgi:uncharacterized protein YbjT (DUF2867 family)
MRIAVLGATGKTGRYVVAALCARGHQVIAIGRNADRLAVLDSRASRALADLERPATLTAALDAAECVASLAHARHTATLLSCLPPSCKRVVLTGSLRKFTSLADPAAEAVRAGEAAFRASGKPGVMLHPSMIYGAPDERNVNRILDLIARFPPWLPVPLPLPDGGRHTVQPIFVDDMVAAVVAAIERAEVDGLTIAVAGPEPITYREMISTCAAALGRTVVIIPLSTKLLGRLASWAAMCGLNLPFEASEFVRAAEDKAFDIKDLRERLGVHPRPFAEGLRLKLARGWRG